jgi:hypothetical protein
MVETFVRLLLPEDSMRKNHFGITVFALVVPVFLSCPIFPQAQVAKPAYPAMLPVDQYLSPDENAEIALARSSAPASISDAAEVMVLKPSGYITAAKGTNGFVCIVQRSWAKPTDDPEFWNPKVRAPNCFNAAASRTFLQIYLMKTKLVLAGKSKAEIATTTASALDKKELPELAPGSMCYMMSKQQYLSDDDMGWHPHVMFFVSGNDVKSWGANLPGSPVYAGPDPEERVTVFMMVAAKWSDGTPWSPMAH